MTITANNIKLLASQVMDDIDQGGGAPTSTVIVDGASNSIFNDISELDRAGGRVNFRKAFASIQTDTTDTYLGGNLIVADPFDDPNVSVTICAAESVFDRRADAAGRVAAYLNAAAEWPGYLYENHIAGQRAIQIFARPGVSAPANGRTLVLVQAEGTQAEVEQYVRVISSSSEERTFTHTLGGEVTDYTAQIITCNLSDALRSGFSGSPASRLFQRLTSAALLRDTVVADASLYSGAVRLVSPVAIGDAAATVESVYAQLVPSAQTESAVIDVRPSSNYQAVLSIAPRLVEIGGAPFSQRVRVGQENRAYNYVTMLSPLPHPGSVRVTYRALGNTYTVTDDGSGNLTGDGSGTVNYTTGSLSVTLLALPDDRSAVIFNWGQTTAYTSRAGSLVIRPPEVVFELGHKGVIADTVEISWLSGGVTKGAVVSAAGKISGDAVGEVNTTSGRCLMRPVAMPDPGTQFSVTYDWEDVVEDVLHGLVPDGTGSVALALSAVPVPGTLEVAWVTSVTTDVTKGTTLTAGSVAKSDSAVVHSDRVKKTGWGPVDVVGVKVYEVYTVEQSTTTSASHMTSAEQTNVSTVTLRHLATDDGAGAFLGDLGMVSYSGMSASIKVVGDYSINSYKSNYEDANDWERLNGTDRAVVAGGTATPNSGGGGSLTAKGGGFGSDKTTEVFSGAAVVARYRVGLASNSATESIDLPAVSIDILPTINDTIVPGSLRFSWMGVTYDDFDGVIYRGRTDTQPGVVSGSVDYASGLVSMTDYVAGANPASVTILSCWTTKGAPSVGGVTFQSNSAPIKPGGLVFSCVDVAGGQLVGTTGASGQITGDHMRGVVDFETGLVEVQFGDYVLDSTLPAERKDEWWYDAAEVQGDGMIWRPWPVNPSTLRYNAVSYSYLPLDATVLGLDPVRLPTDGRVPIFRAGAYAVVGHTAEVGPVAVSAGQTVDCGRERLSRVRVLDAGGTPVLMGFTHDLEAGLVTFTSVDGLAQPVRIEHRIEDMAMVSDVQIGGLIKFTRQLTHDYPVGAVVSSALIMGDLRARTTTLFDQQTWGNVWADAPIGASAPASFNAAAYPIVVNNSGTVTERWAVVFNNSESFSVIGEHVGVVALGNITTDCAPVNPATNKPYFTLPALGFGIGWSAGNVLRFNTVGAFFPFWLVRTIRQGQASVIDDSFTILIRGDIDRP